jgi:hypothetical protein
MKKILVLLLVFATAAGLFALDGDWSLNGQVIIGSYVNFRNDPMSVVGQGYWQPYNWYGPLRGELNANYTLDSLQVGLGFLTAQDAHVFGKMVYDGGNFKFHAESNLFNLIGGDNDSLDRLWGQYDMLSGLIHLEVAYRSQDNNDGLWSSNKVAAFGDTHFRISNPLNIIWPGTNTFTHYDGDNFLLGNVVLENLNFGVILPYIFGDAAIHGDMQAAIPPSVANPGPGQLGGKTGYNLLEDVLKQAVAGLKFTMQPIEVAAQFQMGNYGVYFGGKADISALTVGLSFMGILKDNKLMKFGGGVGFNPGAFGATINAFYGLNMDSKASVIGIEPEFFYNVIPTHLKFQTKVGFYFAKANKDADTDVTWAVEPQLFWNFLGTGAGDYYSGLNTGMFVRYRLVYDQTNALDVTFRWSF